MYPCLNCKAGLRFDIAKQKLVCDHCDSEFDPYEIGRDKDAVEHDTFETTVFTCPQCGGELISDDETAATFCSYCGGTTVLDSRISDEKRPEYIITFKKTKEQCKEAFSKKVKGAIFAPKEYKDPAQIDKFRGIYMPYWSYDFETGGRLSFEGENSYRSGDYIIEETYNISGPVNGAAEGITYDATSTFSDDISMNIAPFNIKEKQKFTPSFLSGFYADTSDVDKTLYSDDATEMVARYNQTQVLSSVAVRGKTVNSRNKDLIKKETMPGIKGAALAFLPVWFLSYKTTDKRVAYAVVNGQTGKTSIDLPVDKKKFLLFSAIIAAALFVVFNFMFTLKPDVLLIVALVVTVITMIIAGTQLSKIKKRETLEDDQGMMYRQKLAEMKSAENAVIQENAESTDSAAAFDNGEITADELDTATAEQKADYIRSDSLALRCAAAVNNGTAAKKTKNKIGGGKGILMVFVSIIIVAAFYAYIPDVVIYIMVTLGYAPASQVISLIGLASIALAAFIVIILWRNLAATGNVFKRGDKSLGVGMGLVKPIISLIVGALVLFLAPVQDAYYYGAAIFCIIMTVLTQFDIINQHNKLTTRKPPQLGRRGGDEYA